MAPDEQDDSGAQDSPPQDDALPTELAQQTAEMASEHGEVLDTLGPSEPPADSADRQGEHADILDELSGALGEAAAPSAVEEIADVPLNETAPIASEAKEPQGRYYVPPQDRTPENRAQRRAEHDRILNEMRKSVETEMDPTGIVPEFTDEFQDRQQEGFDFQTQGVQQDYKTGQSRNNQAVLSMFNTLAGRDMDISHELERLRMRLEQDRL